MRHEFIGVLEALAEHGVDHVLIGGLAANVLGSNSITSDIDVCYERSRPNLVRLAAALQDMDARLRGAPDGVPFLLDDETLWRGDSFTFATRFGAVDVLATPAGTKGYEQLRANAALIDLGDGLLIWVCSLDDLMRMKTAAGRPKDRIELEILGALRDELERRPE